MHAVGWGYLSSQPPCTARIASLHAVASVLTKLILMSIRADKLAGGVEYSGKVWFLHAGTYVDSGICHPTEWDFYLNSHAGLLGTNRPCHYHVLMDQIGFGTDELAILTYRCPSPHNTLVCCFMHAYMVPTGLYTE